MIKSIVHTVGPYLRGQSDNVIAEDKKSLMNYYLNSLGLAKKHNMHSLAFPAISILNYRFLSKLAANLSF
ncbi:MAG TPA: hypothetical protein DCO89_01995 [Clostridiales bacterium]|nr:hypothetical protein [Clostridiales bacterium]